MSHSVTESVHVGRSAVDRLALLTFGAIVGAVGFSLSGLILALVGVFYPVVVVPVGLAASLAFGWFSWKPFRSAVFGRLGHGVGPVLVVVVAILLSGFSASAFSGEHVQTNRDPGVYVTTSVWLADHGDLVIDGLIGGFEGVDGITAGSLGNYASDDEKTISPQFMHLLPVWGAAARWIGGDGLLFRVNAVIVAVATAVFWLFATLLLRPWYAALVTAGLAVNLVMIHFARDLYSEPLTLLFVFAGLALLAIGERVGNRAISFLAGATVGLAAAARIDAWMIVIGVVAYLELRWFTLEGRGDESAFRGYVRPALLGLALTGAVAIADGLARSAPYLAGRGQQVLAMWGLLIVTTIAGLVMRSQPARVWLSPHIPALRSTASRLGPVVVIVAAALLFTVRPLLQEIHSADPNPVIEFAQHAEGIPVDGTRTYAEWSMHWLAWYLGVGALAAGVAGLSLAWKHAVQRRTELLAFLFSALLVSTVYITKPSITGDQLWAMRRFLPITIPALYIGGAFLAQSVAQRWRGSFSHAGVFAVAVVLLVILPGYLAWPLRTSTSYRGQYRVVQEVCAQLPPGAAALMISEVHATSFQAGVRTFCGVPVAGIKDGEDLTCIIEASRVRWSDFGRNLYLIGTGSVTGSAVRSAARSELPEIVVTRRPERMIGLDFVATVEPAPATTAGACPTDGAPG